MPPMFWPICLSLRLGTAVDGYARTLYLPPEQTEQVSSSWLSRHNQYSRPTIGFSSPVTVEKIG